MNIEIGPEREGTNQWDYDVTVYEQGRIHNYHVSLNWADYDLWSRGRKPPSRVVEAAFEFLLDREPASQIMPRFDCSIIRRYFPEVDKRLPQML